MKFFKKYLIYLLIFFLLSGCFLLLYFSFQNHHYLKIVFLDVGQGDAIYIEAPNKNQILIDGGLDQKVLGQLAKVMPFGDRSLNLIIATHPDSDHIGGLVEVLKNYKVNTILENGIISETLIYQNLEKQIVNHSLNKIIAQKGLKIFLDPAQNIYFEIIFPDRDVSAWDTNDGSIVGKLVWNKQSFLLTGDATIYTEILMHQKSQNLLKSTILKLGHHGSRNSSSLLFLEDVDPDYAIISAGKNNRYGHPQPEILNRLKDLRIPFLNTAQEGNIIFKTDGIKLVY